jgi:hypothetical protein
MFDGHFHRDDEFEPVVELNIFRGNGAALDEWYRLRYR